MFRTRKDQAGSLKSLKAVAEHGPIGFVQDVRTNFNNVVRSDADDMGVESSVMQSTKCEAIGNPWFAERVSVAEDMCRVQELAMPETTNCAMLAVRLQHSLSERLLV